MMTDNDQHAMLKEAIETSLKRKMVTPRDFGFLRNAIYDRLNILLSTTTLKRFWGYIECVTPSQYTLNSLAQFLGYSDYKAFVNSSPLQDDCLSSSLVLSRHIHVSEALNPGDIIKLEWYPNRLCTVRYTGNNAFVVVSAEVTKLKTGNTFTCTHISRANHCT
ncbi:MAG: hypothetical protein MJZ74_07560 [Muribaculaceae bacterium]|nr:hypothetical protein [Muribaculaceae bacterium]